MVVTVLIKENYSVLNLNIIINEASHGSAIIIILDKLNNFSTN